MQPYIGWQSNDNYNFLFNPSRLLIYQQKITELLEGVTTRPIIVPIDTIVSVLETCYRSHRPTTGDIYSRYIVGQASDEDDVTKIVNRTINIIVSQIRNEFEMASNNKKLTIWNTLYGDFNKVGLRAHAPLKTRKGGPQRGQIHMRY